VKTYRLPAEDLRTMLIYTFRYALGRRTSAPMDAARFVRTWGVVLHPEDVDQIVRDIERAVESRHAGDPCDVAEWQALAAFLREAPEGSACEACGGYGTRIAACHRCGRAR
jgi:hypothetical protein